MAFRTKLDFSSNRQVRQSIETFTELSGGTKFGVPFSSLPSGPDLTTTGETFDAVSVISLFSGNNTTTNFTWFYPEMQDAEYLLSAITPTTSAATQEVGPVFTPTNTTIIDGNTVNLEYSGISYDLYVDNIVDLGGGNYSGTVQSDELFFYSASTLDFTGRTIWADVSGITRTQKLIVTDTPQIGYVLTCVDSEGMSKWEPVSAVTSGATLWLEGSGNFSLYADNDSGLDATGDYALAEGFNTLASGDYSHAEGASTTASGFQSHAEGQNTQAIGNASHAEGDNTIASGDFSHAEGNFTIASGSTSHAEGINTQALGIASHAEGAFTTASGFASHAEGQGTEASGGASHAEGFGTTAGGDYSHAEGNITTASGDSSHAEGINTQALGIASHAEGQNTLASANGSHAEGQETIASGTASHAEGYQTTANGTASHSEGLNTIASGFTAHAEGENTRAIGDYSHAEGFSTSATTFSSHAEGRNTLASGGNSHAEGQSTQALGDVSHAQGFGSKSIGSYSHAGGFNTIASGSTSFVHGSNSEANGINTIVLGASITGNTNNTTYVDYLNIKNVLATASVNDIRIDANGNLTTNTSDERLKENINPITNALDKVKQLQGVTYQWKDRNAGGDTVRLGFIAQEVEEVEPLLVFTNNDESQHKGLHIDGIIPLLVEAVKEIANGSTVYLETQTILAEDNNIDLNFNGNQQSAINGGIRVLHAKGVDQAAEFIIDSTGDWITNNKFKPNSLVIPNYAPTSSNDSFGEVGDIVRDENYIYIKTGMGWKRANLETF
jgi:hypothetical protein